MPIISKYSNEQIEQILSEVTGILEKHSANAELSLMVVGNIATNILNQNVPYSQRKIIADKFAQALLSSVNEKH